MRERYVEMVQRGVKAIAEKRSEHLYLPRDGDRTKVGTIAGVNEVFVNAEGTVVVKVEGRGCCKRFAAQLFMKDVDFAATCTGEGGRYTFNSTFNDSVKMLMEIMTHINYHFSKSELCRDKTK